METIDNNYNSEYFYLVGVLLILLFSFFIDARPHRSLASTATPLVAKQSPESARLNNETLTSKRQFPN